MSDYSCQATDYFAHENDEVLQSIEPPDYDYDDSHPDVSTIDPDGDTRMKASSSPSSRSATPASLSDRASSSEAYLSEPDQNTINTYAARRRGVAPGATSLGSGSPGQPTESSDTKRGHIHPEQPISGTDSKYDHDSTLKGASMSAEDELLLGLTNLRVDRYTTRAKQMRKQRERGGVSKQSGQVKKSRGRSEVQVSWPPRR